MASINQMSFAIADSKVAESSEKKEVRDFDAMCVNGLWIEWGKSRRVYAILKTQRTFIDTDNK